MVSSTEGSAVLESPPVLVDATGGASTNGGANNNSYPPMPPAIPIRNNGAIKKINNDVILPKSPQISEKSISPLRLSESENEDDPDILDDIIGDIGDNGFESGDILNDSVETIKLSTPERKGIESNTSSRRKASDDILNEDFVDVMQGPSKDPGNGGLADEEGTSKIARISTDIHDVITPESNSRNKRSGGTFPEDAYPKKPKLAGKIDEKKGREKKSSADKPTADESAADLSEDDETLSDRLAKRKKEKKVLKIFQNVQSSLKKMTRRELELYLATKIVDAIETSSSLARYKDAVRAQHDRLLRLETSALQLRKQMHDLDYVHNKAIGHVNANKKGGLPPPPYITRSVGLQVTISGPPLSNVRPGGIGVAGGGHHTTAIHSTNTCSRRSHPAAHNHLRKISPSPRRESQSPQKRSPQQQQQQNRTTSTTGSGISPRNSAGQQLQQSPQQQSQMLPPPQPQPVNIIRNLNAAPPETPNPGGRGVTIDLTEEEDRPATNTNRFDPTKQPIYLLPQNGQNVIIATPQNNGTNRPNTTTLMIRSLNSTNTIQSATNGLMYTAATPRAPNAPSSGVPATPQFGPAGGGPRRSSLPLGGGALPVRSAKTAHPAPLPRPDNGMALQQRQQRRLPARPAVKISQVAQGIVISWTMPDETADHPQVASYQIYAYQETDVPPTADLWRKVGDVKAMPLPMACTLTQFMFGNRYHFAVRAVDVESHIGPFSVPNSILLGKDN